jgi:hypothetical protein
MPLAGLTYEEVLFHGEGTPGWRGRCAQAVGCLAHIDYGENTRASDV